MNTIIIGAGIAGLSAGIALRRAGHHVTILEQSSLLHEVGAAISVAPNASRVLRSWDFDIAKAQMVAIDRASVLNGTSMEVVMPDYQANIERDFGTPVFAVHRVDLHSQLRELAVSQDGSGKPCVLHVRSKVVHYDVEEASVKLADGSVWSGDLVIAADGVHSIAKDYVLEESEQTASNTGWASMRWLVRTEELLADSNTASLVQASTQRYYAGREGGGLVWYMCRNNTVQNFLYLSKSFAPSARTEDFHAGVDASMVMEYAEKDFSPELQAVLAKAKDVKFWKLIARDPVPRWHKGNLVMIGDAAHPMLPFQAQGGGQAIEDAAALGVLLDEVKDEAVLAERLGLFEDVRHDRGAALQLLSNAAPPLTDSVYDRVARYLPKGVVIRNHEDIKQYVFSFDVLEAARDALAKSGAGV